MNTPQKWLNVEDDMFIHVVPDPDAKPHGTKISDVEYELTATCACNPKVETGGGKPIVIHSSFDVKDALDKQGL